MAGSATSINSSDDFEVHNSASSYSFPSGKLSRSIRCEFDGDLNILTKAGTVVACPFLAGETQSLVCAGFAVSSVGRVTIYY